jgi:quercetin dioxygenase-like cupin family protein
MERIMKHHPAIPSAVIALLFGATPALAVERADGAHAAAHHPGTAAFHNPENLQWGDAPPVLPPGAQAVVLDGDPHQAGPYVLRLKLPAGYRIPPHWHSKPEIVTVISGTLSLGMGDTLDPAAAEELKTGGFHAIGAGVHHYAFTRSGAVVQIHGDGPFDITYINPADNPAPPARTPGAQ